MSRLRLAFVGCGDFARITAIAAKLNPHIKLAACFDINKDAAIKFAKANGINNICNSYDEILASDVDAVYLPVPHFLHYDYIKKALNTNKHVFTEKPLCLTTNEAKELIEISNEKKLILSVNFHNRYSRKVQRLVKNSKSNRLGEHIFTNITVPWHRDEKYMNKDSWHGKKELSGGGTLITQGIHALDIGIMCGGGEVISLYGSASNFKFLDVETEDTFTLTINFDNNSTLHFNSTMAFTKDEPAQIDYYGTNGSMKVKLPSTIGFIKAVYKSLEDFRKSSITGYKPLNHCENFLKITEIVEKAYLSAETGEVIHITKER